MAVGTSTAASAVLSGLVIAVVAFGVAWATRTMASPVVDEVTEAAAGCN